MGVLMNRLLNLINDRQANKACGRPPDVAGSDVGWPRGAEAAWAGHGRAPRKACGLEGGGGARGGGGGRGPGGGGGGGGPRLGWRGQGPGQRRKGQGSRCGKLRATQCGETNPGLGRPGCGTMPGQSGKNKRAVQGQTGSQGISGLFISRSSSSGWGRGQLGSWVVRRERHGPKAERWASGEQAPMPGRPHVSGHGLQLELSGLIRLGGRGARSENAYEISYTTTRQIGISMHSS